MDIFRPHRLIVSQRAWDRIERIGFRRYVALVYAVSAALPFVIWLVLRSMDVPFGATVPMLAMPFFVLGIGAQNHWACHVNRRFYENGQRL